MSVLAQVLPPLDTQISISWLQQPFHSEFNRLRSGEMFAEMDEQINSLVFLPWKTLLGPIHAFALESSPDPISARLDCMSAT